MGKRVMMGVLIGSALVGGCGPSGGAALYFTGLFQRKKVPAEFTLTTGPILILIDDPKPVVDWPVFLRLVNDDLGQELLRNKAAQKIIPIQTLQSIEQTEANYAKRGAREIGELAGADQVLWIEMRDFLAPDSAEDLSEAAYAVASVKVIDVHAENRAAARVWPSNPQGKVVSVKRTGSEVARAKTRDAVSKDLSAALSVKIARNFYAYRPEDTEEEEP